MAPISYRMKNAMMLTAIVIAVGVLAAFFMTSLVSAIILVMTINNP